MKIYILLTLFAFAPALKAEEDNLRKKMADLYELRSKIKKQVFDRSRHQQQEQRLSQELSLQATKIKELSKNRDELIQGSRQRLISVYKKSRGSSNWNILSLGRSKDYFKKVAYLRTLDQYDKALVKRIQENQKRLEKEKARFEKRLSYYKDLRKKNEFLLADLQSRESEKRRLLQQIKSLQQDESSNSSLEGDFSSLRGHLKSPVLGRPVVQFGLKRDHRTGLWLLNSGVYFEASESEVKSVSSGHIRFHGSLPYWGESLVVDHGDSYTTIYTNIKNPSVRLGDEVAEGQKLADLGDLKYDGKYNHYFEIRQYTEPQDPREWLIMGAAK